MQGQFQLPLRVQVDAPSDTTAGQLVEVKPGGQVGWANDEALAGEPVTLHIRVLQNGTKMADGTKQTYTGEAWALGDQIYYNRLTALVGKDCTDQRMGWAYEAKAANVDQACVFSDDGARDGKKVLITLDFAKAENAALVAGALPLDLLIDLGPFTIVSGSVRGVGLTSNSGGDIATISIGDSAGTGVEVLAATVVTVLNATTAVNTDIAITENLIMRFGVEAVDGGKLIFEAVRSDI